MTVTAVVPTVVLSTPGPVDDIRHDDAHRVGAPNHHVSGSGENPMVDNNISLDIPVDIPPIATSRATGAEAVGDSDSSWPGMVRFDALVATACWLETENARLEAENAWLTADNTRLRAERDMARGELRRCGEHITQDAKHAGERTAAGDAVLDLLDDLEGGGV